MNVHFQGVWLGLTTVYWFSNRFGLLHRQAGWCIPWNEPQVRFARGPRYPLLLGLEFRGFGVDSAWRGKSISYRFIH